MKLESSRIRRRGLVLGFSALVLAACGGGEEQKVAQGALKRAQAATSGSAADLPIYTTRRIDLGIPGGSVTAKGINASGQVAGEAPSLPSGITHAFYFDGTSSIDLGVLPGRFSSRAVALNSSGQVIGSSESPVQAFSWTSPGPMVALSTAGLSISQAVNDAGFVVGLDTSGASNSLAGFAWSSGSGYTSFATTFSRFDAVNNAGTMAGRLVTPTPATGIAAIRRSDGTVVAVTTGSGFARLINDAELVAGQLGTAPSSGRAFAWQGGTSYPIGEALAAQGYNTSLAIDLNQVGQLVGYANSSTGAIDGFIWTSGSGLSFLGGFPGSFPSTLPRAVNNHGQVVGAAGSSTFMQRAFLWTAASGIVDLTTRVFNPPAGFMLLDAMAISDNGSIVARSNTGQLLLLVPVAPGTALPPTLGPIAANDPVKVGTPVDVSLAFSDFNTGDTHTALWDWGDGSTSDGTVSEGNGAGTITGAHAYASAGIYRVTVTVTDSGGQKATVGRDVVVFDPEGGTVSGSGWFDSPMGAYKADPLLAGKADFGFVAKYARGATVPNGQTMFQFVTAGLRFRSDAYDWLVVAGARAQYKGVGTLNGIGGYRFMLTAIDGDKLGRGTPDRFRIRIWHFDEDLKDVVDYDNQVDASGEGGNDEGTALGGGSIVIQR